MIHPNREAAQKACEDYERALHEAREKYGAYEECDDSCCDVYICAQYLDKDGDEQKFSMI